ncbi:uncharacterized protein PV07_04708 [Cladophialophora immunda]|uniref:Uncharacterized protein n=1 Tax=Cladophialophora immunda TaxID=569365 RepID=A0A0D2CF16_9EURO|nr:uncharacterized protein PV07_04708 [Cladophialophora immunda]KIW28845.1 hypothetical protein PV07_04708 [Cladophialophora immunda]
MMQMIDKFTVEMLQLRVPGRCKEDFEFVQPLMANGSLFAFVTDTVRRDRIWENILNVQTLIPSLHGLGEDKKFLNPLAKILKRLFPVSRTLRRAMADSFKNSDESSDAICVQESESSIRYYTGSPTQQLSWGIFQLFLFAGRDFSLFIPETPLKERGRPTPEPKEPDPYLWTSLARFASNLGFESDEISRLLAADPDETRTSAFLLQARKPPTYTFSKSQFEENKKRIIEILNTAEKKTSSFAPPTLFVEQNGEGIERRCGRHWELAYQYDHDYTFLPLFWTEDEISYGRGLSSLFVRVAVYKAFFGDLIFCDTVPIPPIPSETSTMDLDSNLFSQSLSNDIGGRQSEVSMLSPSLSNENSEGRQDEFLAEKVRILQLEVNKLRADNEERNTAERMALEDSRSADRQLQDYKSTNESLTSEITELKSRLHQMQSEHQESTFRLESQNSDLQKQLDQRSQESQNLSELSVTHRDRAVELEAYLSKTQLALGNITAQEMKFRFDNVLEENTELQTQLQQAQESLKQKTMAEQCESQMKEEIIRLTETLLSELRSLGQAMTKTRQQLDKRRGEIPLIDYDNVSLSLKKEGPGLQLTRVDNVSLESKLYSEATLHLRQNVQEVSEAKDIVAKEWLLLSNWVITLGEAFSTLELGAQEAQKAQEQNLREEREKFQSEKNKWDIELQKATSDKDRAWKEHSDLESRVNTLSQEVEEKQAQVNLFSQGREALQQEIVDLKSQILLLKSSTHKLHRDNNRKLKAQIRKQQAEIGETEQAFKAKSKHFTFQPTPKAGIEKTVKVQLKITRDPGPPKELDLSRAKLEDILRRCKKHGLIPYDTQGKAMMPEDAWDIISADSTYTVVLHLLEDIEIDEGFWRDRKRKKQFHSTEDNDGGEVAEDNHRLRLQDTSEILRYVLSRD